MAYPSTSFKLVNAPAGTQPITETSTTQKHKLGMEVEGHDYTYGAGKFIYLKGVASTAPGDLVTYESDTGTTTRAVAGGGASTGACAVAMSANLADQYGWYQVEGAGPVYAATVSDNTALYLTATAGQVDDTAASGELVDGLRAKAATSGDYATCQINRPNVTGMTSTGTNTGDVTLASVGSSPAAAGASLSGQVLTLQPASATQPGVVTTGAQTIAGVKTFADGVVTGSLTVTGFTDNFVYTTLVAAAESGNAIVVSGQIKVLTGANVAQAMQLVVHTLAVTDDKGDITVTDGTSKKVVNPATGANMAWLTSDADGTWAVSVANDVAEDTLLWVTLEKGFVAAIKLNFALV